MYLNSYVSITGYFRNGHALSDAEEKGGGKHAWFQGWITKVYENKKGKPLYDVVYLTSGR